jgi:hypothetical protein
MRSTFRDSETDWKRQKLMQSDISMFFVVRKYTTLYSFRCHLGIDFDIGQREGK